MNQKTTFQKLVAVFLLISNATTAQLSLNYLGDSGIEKDPNVIFTEMFEDTDVNAMISNSNYTVSKVLGNISFDNAVPIGSTGKQSCKLTTIDGTTNGEDTYLFKRLSSGIDDVVFVRYYIKFNNQFTFHHSGVWMGGHNPPTPYPGLRAGELVSGDQSFHVGTESRGAVKSPQDNATFGFFNYWMGMKQSVQINPNTGVGYYWGNEFLPLSTISMTDWNCVEVMVKMNKPVSDNNGELALWINGVKIIHLGKGFPNGSWKDQIFTENSNGTPFDGMQWRSDPALLFNYIWMKNYSTNNDTNTAPNDVWYDHLVVAKEYIGPIAVQTLSDNEFEKDSSISIVPNPATNWIKINTRNESLKSIQLFNTNGSLLGDYLTNEISTEHLPKGVYFLSIQTEEKTVNKKFIKI